MSKKYQVSDKRYIVVKKDEIRLFEDGSHRQATFTYPRWVWFTEQFGEVDDALGKLVKAETDIKVKLHVGGGWFVSVTSGFPCVDVQKFYIAIGGAIKPTRMGLAIRLAEWDRVKEIARQMKDQHPKIAETVPCWTGSDHFNQEGAIACPECNPFGNWFAAQL